MFETNIWNNKPMFFYTYNRYYIDNTEENFYKHSYIDYAYYKDILKLIT